MTEYLLSPRGTTAPRENLRDMLEAGELEAFRVRTDGTTRLINLLPVASTSRETAEWIYDQVEDGRSVQAVAREIHVSVATIRRFLEALELTEQVEAGEWDDTWAELHGFARKTPVDEMSDEQLAEAFQPEGEATTDISDLENIVAPESEVSNA